MLFFILRRQKDKETDQRKPKEKNLRHCEMKEHSVDNKEANWNRMNSAVKRISQASSETGMMGKQPHPRWKKEFGVVRILKKQESVSSVSEVVSLLTRTQVLQMRGRADADVKMGHERDAPPNPRAMCCNFRLSAPCQVCRHQLLGMWKRCGQLGAAKRNQEVLKKSANHKVVVHKSSDLMLTAAHQFFLENRKRVCGMN